MGIWSDVLGDFKVGIFEDLDVMVVYLIFLDGYFVSFYRNGDGIMMIEVLVGYSIFEELECYFCYFGK